jgi:hypothetical protein
MGYASGSSGAFEDRISTSGSKEGCRPEAGAKTRHEAGSAFPLDSWLIAHAAISPDGPNDRVAALVLEVDTIPKPDSLGEESKFRRYEQSPNNVRHGPIMIELHPTVSGIGIAVTSTLTVFRSREIGRWSH